MKKEKDRLPANLSAWVDLTVHLAVMLAIIAMLSFYNSYIAAISLVLWVCLASFARERCRDRSKRFERYCKSVIGSISQMMSYAVGNLPQAIIIVNQDGRIEWTNERVVDVMGANPGQDRVATEVWPGLVVDAVWGMEGEYVFSAEERFYKVRHVPIKAPQKDSELLSLYIEDVSAFEQLKNEYMLSRTSLLYLQIDNYDEVMQGLNETDRTTLLLAVNKQIDEWLKNLSGFFRRVTDDLYVVILTRNSLDTAIRSKFDILDKIRAINSTNKIPVTLSIGVSVADRQTMAKLGSEAQAELDLALGRGGDQAAVLLGGKTQFFGGRTQAVEKHTRVKARVVAHAIREVMEGADEIFIMGHLNEDFDCFGAAIGVARMAKFLDKETHIVLSDLNEGIDKLITLLNDKADYKDLLMRGDNIGTGTSLNPLLFVVDTHIPRLVACPALLNRVKRVIVIDHHRRSETSIRNPFLVYIEPSASSTSELVTEILGYFAGDGENMEISRLDATALYSGIVVDTKNFAVQTGVRTFDAAAFLRRNGADPVVVRHLFRSDYETAVALAKTQANSEYYEGGLVVSVCPENVPNIQVIAAQAADSFLRIENTRMSIVCFKLNDNTIGLSARSAGELNVQVIMETFGGHQNVAGAQIKSNNLESIKKQVIETARKYIEETDADDAQAKTKA